MIRLTASNRHKLIALAASLLVVVLGYVLMVTRAAGYVANVDASAASLSGNASILTEGDGTRALSFNSPSGGTACALPNYPNAACTGVPSGVALNPYITTTCTPGLTAGDTCNVTAMDGTVCVKYRESTNGSISDPVCTLTTANKILENIDASACFIVEAPGIIIRKSHLACTGISVILSYSNSYSGTGLLLEDVDISCNGAKGSAISEFNVTVRRADISGCRSGYYMHGPGLIEDSYIHDLIAYDPATDPHIDGVQLLENGHDITVRHNTVYAGDGTSAITSAKLSDGIVSNMLIEDNLLAGGTYTLYCHYGGSGINYRVINNHFSTTLYPSVGIYGPWVECQDETQVTGNVYHETGQPVPF